MHSNNLKNYSKFNNNLHLFETRIVELISDNFAQRHI
jgi:hypothetical protein